MSYSHEVHAQSDDRSDEHHGADDLEFHAYQSLDGHETQNPGDHPYEQHRRQGAQHLDPIPAERQGPCHRSRRHPDGAQGDHEAGEVREQVRGVGGDRQAAGQVAACGRRRTRRVDI